MAEQVHETKVIDAPPSEVWAVLMDPGRLGEWVSAHRKLEGVPDVPLTKGDSFRQRLGVGPVGFWVEWEILEAEEPSLARWRGDGPGGSTASVTYRLEAEGDTQTRFDYENDFDPPGGILGRAANRAVNATAGKREAQKSLKALAALFD